MAVFTPNDAFAYAKTMVKSMRLDDIKLRILFDASSMVWHAAPWPWTLGEIAESPLTVVASTTEYTITVPSDFNHLKYVILTDGDKIFSPIAVRAFLPANSVTTGQTLEIAKVEGQAKVRVYPKPPASMPSAAQKLLMFYKKDCPNLTASDYASTSILSLDDDWFRVYCAAVLYFAYLYGDDDRAGSAIYEPKGESYRFTGQRAVLETELQQMRTQIPLSRVLDIRNDLIDSRG